MDHGASRPEQLRGGVRISALDGVVRVDLDRPERRNALSDALLAELEATFTQLRGETAARCVVLGSTDPKTFSAGGDLDGFAAERTQLEKYEDMRRLPAVFEAIGSLGKPVICAVDGHCLAGALGLALACDLIVASDRASFGTPEIKVGLFPFMIGALLSRSVPIKKAIEMMLLGERIDAREGERLGFVNKVVPAAELEARVAEWAGRLAASPPGVMRVAKDALAAQRDVPLAAALEMMRSQLALTQESEEAREGILAFKEKREPAWPSA